MRKGLTRQETITYAVMIFPGFPVMAFSAVIEPLRAANLLEGKTCLGAFRIAAFMHVSGAEHTCDIVRQ